VLFDRAGELALERHISERVYLLAVDRDVERNLHNAKAGRSTHPIDLPPGTTTSPQRSGVSARLSAA
jgi:hypothetical protein